MISESLNGVIGSDMWGDLHETKTFTLRLPRVVSAGEGNRLFRSLGAALFYDVYAFLARESEPWQSESILNVHLLKDGQEVDARVSICFSPE